MNSLDFFEFIEKETGLSFSEVMLLPSEFILAFFNDAADVFSAHETGYMKELRRRLREFG